MVSVGASAVRKIYRHYQSILVDSEHNLSVTESLRPRSDPFKFRASRNKSLDKRFLPYRPDFWLVDVSFFCVLFWKRLFQRLALKTKGGPQSWVQGQAGTEVRFLGHHLRSILSFHRP